MSLGDAVRQLDDTIHSPIRFALMSALASVDDATYQTLKDELGITYGLLSKHANILENAGYLLITKSFLAKKPQTTFSLTRLGRKAYKHHIEALDQLRKGLR